MAAIWVITKAPSKGAHEFYPPLSLPLSPSLSPSLPHFPLSLSLPPLHPSLPLHRLTAEDVMNPHLKYLYPITRVGSIVSQLRTTAHSAFLVVTPVSLDKVHQKPQTMARHTPQLYSKRNFRDHALSVDSGTYSTAQMLSNSLLFLLR